MTNCRLCNKRNRIKHTYIDVLCSKCESKRVKNIPDPKTIDDYYMCCEKKILYVETPDGGSFVHSAKLTFLLNIVFPSEQSAAKNAIIKIKEDITKIFD